METSGGASKPVSLAWAFIVVTLVLIVALFWQLLDVYFVLGGEAVEPTDREHTRYLVTASACGVSAVAAVIAATKGGRAGTRVMSLITFVAALVAATLFAVPTIDLHRDPAPNRLPDNYEPCYSGSNECN
ncbi:hypothetical protein GCM10022234_36490 [Aeromicrobium panaciterrae]|uniref:DUF6234 family protein n=1 Tax=Aeromicrobium panaciterrae TaxID=363861 RepID=UPI0031E277B9